MTDETQETQVELPQLYVPEAPAEPPHEVIIPPPLAPSEADKAQTDYVTYEKATGRITTWGQVPLFVIALQTPPEGQAIQVGYGREETHYVADGQVLVRPANTATLDGMSLKNLPNPCVITTQGVAHDCTDDTADLSFSQPGTFEVKVSAFPMLDATFQVTQS